MTLMETNDTHEMGNRITIKYISDYMRTTQVTQFNSIQFNSIQFNSLAYFNFDHS